MCPSALFPNLPTALTLSALQFTSLCSFITGSMCLQFVNAVSCISKPQSGLCLRETFVMRHRNKEKKRPLCEKSHLGARTELLNQERPFREVILSDLVRIVTEGRMSRKQKPEQSFNRALPKRIQKQICFAKYNWRGIQQEENATQADSSLRCDLTPSLKDQFTQCNGNSDTIYSH